MSATLRAMAAADALVAAFCDNGILVDLLPGGLISMRYPYHPDMIDAAKRGGCWWDRDSRTWRISAEASTSAAKEFERAGLFGAELADQIRRVASSPGCANELARADQQKLLDAAAKMPDLAGKIERAMPAGAPKLFDFQRVGVGFAMVQNGRVIIADEMGLGKTVQALAYLAVNRQARPAVIVAPPAAMLAWERAIDTWLGEKFFRVRTGNDTIEDAPVILCPWSLLAKQCGQIYDKRPAAMVLDEGHYAKDGSSQRGGAVMRLAGAPGLVHRLVLTGTPMLNRPRELYPLLNFVQPGAWGTENQFFHQFCGPKLMKFGKRRCWTFDGISNGNELATRLVPVMIRRMKQDVLKDLPPKHRISIPIEAKLDADSLPPAELEKLKKAVALQDAGLAFAAMATMRRLCGLAKAKQAVEWIKDALETTNKIVVFAHHSDVQRIVFEALASYSPVWISGGMTPDEKGAAVTQFQTNPKARVIVCSLGAAREAITLTAANLLVMAERDWVPGAEAQAEDRIHRIGQTAPCTVVRLMSDHPIDIAIQEVIDRKTAVAAHVLGQVETAERKMSALHLDLAASMLKFSQKP